MHRITLKDIALKTGLDVSTVSRVLNRDAGLRISDVKRQEVERVAIDLGYTPHRTARGMRLRRNFIVGFALTDTDAASPFQATLEFPATRARLYGLEEKLAHSGYLLSLVRVPVDERSATDTKMFNSWGLDGLVYNWRLPTVSTLETLRKANIRAVLIDPLAPAETVDPYLNYVMPDRTLGIHNAMEYLALEGHHSVAYISLNTNSQRLAGYRSAVAELSLNTDARLTRLFDVPAVEIAGSIRAEGRHAARELIESGVAFTAVQTGSDTTAVGVVDALKEAGLRVPEDVAVMGYDDVEGYTQYLNQDPFLSTVRDPNREMGVKAAELLLDQIENDAAPGHIVLTPELVLRRSA